MSDHFAGRATPAAGADLIVAHGERRPRTMARHGAALLQMRSPAYH
jgi:hypothetical protein